MASVRNFLIPIRTLGKTGEGGDQYGTIKTEPVIWSQEFRHFQNKEVPEFMLHELQNRYARHFRFDLL